MRAPWLALAAAPLVLAGCAAIPTSGPIQQGPEVPDGQSDQVIRVIVRPPSPDMTPTQIVSGFIEASASFEDDHAVARQYLTAQAAASWDPSAGTRVYDGVPNLAANGPATVDMTATQAGSITADGRFQVSGPGRILSESFTLDYVEGQWRIANPPPGLFLARSDIDRAFRSYDVYFLDPDFTTLVPDTRLIPAAGAGLATALMQALASGPTDWLAPAVRTALPDGAGLAVNAVPVEEGVAVVDLDASVRLMGDATRRALSAQIAWTLGQVPGVLAIDLRAGGQVLPVPGVPNPQPEDAWPGFDPNAMPTNAAPYAERNGRVVQISGAVPLSVPGGAGAGVPPLQGIAVTLDGSRIAGLNDQGALWAADTRPGAASVDLISEPGQSRPSFGRGTAAWVVSPDQQLKQARVDGTVYTIPVDGLSPKMRVESVSVSRDGTRIALIVRRGPRTFVMMAVVVLREGVARVQTPVRVDDRLTSVIDVAWAEDDRLLALGSEGAGTPQVYEIDLARATVRSLGAPSDPVRVAAAPGFPPLAASADGQIYSYAGGPWVALGFGGSPAYPGS